MTGWGRGRIGALALVAGLAATLPAGAQQAERLGPLDTAAVPSPLVPRAEPGDAAPWVDRVHLVYIAETRRLERRAYRARRAPYEAGLVFDWTPRDLKADRPGAVTGDGRMTWRMAGSAAYDASAIVAVYEGGMQDGLRHGHGRYTHRSGFAYEGDWRDGLMHGKGRVALANGDHYAGSFREGQLDGFGRYILSDGTVHEGWYRDGVRHGAGTVGLSDAPVFRATWAGGRELSGSRDVLVPELLHRVQQSRDFRVAVTLDALSVDDGEDYGNSDPADYRAFADGETLRVEPASERLMGIWRGRLPIQLDDGEEIAVDIGGGFLGHKPDTIRPVALVFEFENRGRSPARIVDAALEVSESVTDREPMLQIARGPDNECYNNRAFFDPGFEVQNFGWGAAENAEMSLQIVDQNGRPVGQPFRHRVGTVDTRAEVDLSAALSTLGVDTRRARQGFTCRVPNDLDYDARLRAEERCVEQVRRSGAFGDIAPALYAGFGRLMADVSGRLSHQWRDARDRVQSRTVPFTSKLSLGEFELVSPECGEGGEIADPNARPFQFRPDTRNYRLRVGIREQVPPGVTARWRIRVEADRASNNVFRMAFSLSDGTIVRSRPVDVLFFRPREF